MIVEKVLDLRKLAENVADMAYGMLIKKLKGTGDKHMICLEGVEMPENCHDCGSLGISDVVGLKCPCDSNTEKYDFENRPEGCPLYDLSDK